MPTILVVEDEPGNADLLVQILRFNGYQTLTAEDGIQAIEMAREARPNLILMDMGLPNLDGWNATAQLKASPHTGGIPIIALTAYAFPADQARAYAAGCDDFESKPFSFDSLMDKIGRLLQTSQAHAQEWGKREGQA